MLQCYNIRCNVFIALLNIFHVKHFAIRRHSLLESKKNINMIIMLVVPKETYLTNGVSFGQSGQPQMIKRRKRLHYTRCHATVRQSAKKLATELERGPHGLSRCDA